MLQDERSLCKELDLLQNCDQDIWDAAMQQFKRLIDSSASDKPGIAGLPEEALTQIYQAHPFLEL